MSLGGLLITLMLMLSIIEKLIRWNERLYECLKNQMHKKKGKCSVVYHKNWMNIENRIKK